MRLVPRSSRFLRWLAPVLCMLACSAGARAQNTTVTGTVFAPNGTDPLPNILVYIATPGVPVAGFQPGPGADCDNQNATVTGNPLAEAITDYKGNFTLTSAALTSIGSATVDVVIQAGKWRRQYPATVITGGGPNPVGTLTMPKDATEGDLPQIAIVTGSADAVECVLQSIGINTALEVTDILGSGHINLFTGTGAPGAQFSATSTTTEAGLMSNAALLNNYDVLMLGCQGTPTDPTSSVVDYQKNLASYANRGGRVFATHYSYVWLDKPDTFASTAKWRPDGASITPNNGTGTITVDTSYAEGVILADWLTYIHASPAGPGGYGQLPLISNLRQDQYGVIAPTQSWGTLNPPYTAQTVGTPVMQFTFDTPIGASTAPSIILDFVNSPASFLSGDTGDTIIINVNENSASAPTLPGMVLTVIPPPGVVITNMTDTSPNPGWNCSVASLTCVEANSLAPGTKDSITLTVSIPPGGPLGPATLTAAVTGGGLSNTGKCGRVLFNEYHVEPPAPGGPKPIFPNECPAKPANSSAEKFLEFSLYNLSNFVSPITTDLLQIRQQTVINWPTPAPMNAGTALSATQLNATTTVPIPGTFTYTPAAGTVPAPGLVTLSVVFTPTDQTSYTSATASVQLQVNLIPTSLLLRLCVDQPSSNFPCSTPIESTPLISPISFFYGQILDGVAIESATNLGGTITFLEGTRVFCVLNANLTAGSNACPANSGMFHAGSGTVTAVYSGDPVYLPSVSNPIDVTVFPDPTTAIITSSKNPAVQGTSVTFTATIAGNFATPIGTVDLLDGTTLLATVPLNAAGIATYTTSSLPLGLHAITVSYVGNPDFNPIKSAVLSELITAPPVVIQSAITLTSSLNPSAPSQQVIFTATVSVPGPLAIIPTGNINFLDGTTVIGTSAINPASGVALFTTSTLATGSHPITASYAGVIGNQGGTPVRPPNLPGSLNPAVHASPLETVYSSFQLRGPAGSRHIESPIPAVVPRPQPPVQLAADLRPQASAAVSTPTILPSVSVVVTQIVTSGLGAEATRFVLTVTPVPVTIGTGRTAVMLVNVRAASGFHQPVQLSCSGLPAEAACTFVQTMIPVGGGSTTLQLSTTAPRPCGTDTPYFLGSLRSGSSPARLARRAALPTLLGGAFLLAGYRRRSRRATAVKRTLLVLVLSILSLAGLSGCGNCTDLGTRPGVYTIVVTGVAQGGPLTETEAQSIQLTVTIP